MELYRIYPRAQADLEEIFNFIAIRMENPRGAIVVADYLHAAFEKIGRNPSGCGGKRKPHITKRPVKFLNVKKYVVAYEDREKPVVIMRIFGARQDIARRLRKNGK
jgi:plasmid stabilization system protein ParE